MKPTKCPAKKKGKKREKRGDTHDRTSQPNILHMDQKATRRTLLLYNIQTPGISNSGRACHNSPHHPPNGISVIFQLGWKKLFSPKCCCTILLSERYLFLRKVRKKIFLFILIHCLIISIFPWRDLQQLIINHAGHNLHYWLHEWCCLSSIQTSTHTRWSMRTIIFDLTHQLMTKQMLVFNNSPI